jgi:hypothetical protein
MRKIFLLGMILATSAYPLAVSAATWDLKVDDTIAGFGAEIDIEGSASTEVEVRVTPPQGKDIVLTGETDSRGEAILELDASDTERAGIYEVSIGTSSETFEVFPGAPSLFSLETEEALKKGSESTLSAGIEDEYGNPIAGRPLLLLADSGEVRKIDEATDDDGIARFSFTPDKSGKVTFTIVDVLSEETEKFAEDVGGTSGGSALRASLLDEFEKEEEAEEETEYGFIDHFAIESDDRSIGINAPFDIAIVALDKNDKRVQDYVGKVIVRTSDPDGQVPRTAVKFYASDRGRVDLPLSVTFGTPGVRTIRVYDDEDSTIEGEVEFRVFGGDRPMDQGHIVIVSPGSAATVGAGPVSIEVHAPAYINLVLYENGEVKATGASDAEGTFIFSVTLDPSLPRHELYVAEGEGGLDRKSGTITLTIDTTIPQIKSIMLLPDHVTVGGEVTVSVIADKTHTVHASLAGGAEVSFAEGENAEEGFSVYEATLTAPTTPGTYPVVVRVSDAAGNDAKETKSLTVEASGLPPAAGVRADVFDRDVTLSWLPVDGASQYRIYFGIHPQDLAYHIDTGSSASSAKLTGLQGGQTYYFAVTALSVDNRESTTRGEIISATTRGSLFQVSLTPTINGARMQWVTPAGAEVIAYRIQYGVQPGLYTEQRLVAPGAQQLEIRDLINGVTYFVSLGALLKDGQLLMDEGELTVVPGQGGRPGMHLAPLDPLPPHLATGGPSHSAPIPRSGLPLSFLFGASIMGVIAVRSLRSLKGAPSPSAVCQREKIQW